MQRMEQQLAVGQAWNIKAIYFTRNTFLKLQTGRSQHTHRVNINTVVQKQPLSAAIHYYLFILCLSLSLEIVLLVCITSVSVQIEAVKIL